MKTVKKRTVSIIHELIGNKELMTLSELAEKFEVSQRTIRNDLKLRAALFQECILSVSGDRFHSELKSLIRWSLSAVLVRWI